MLGENDFRLAQIFFLIAAADASGGVLMWGIKTNGPTWQLALAAFMLIGGIQWMLGLFPIAFASM